MAGTPSLFAGIGAQFFDNNGVPLAGGKIYTYAAGTTTPAATYTTEAATTAHTNPIVLDSAGRVPSGGEIWLKEGDGPYYKFVLKTAVDVLIATYDFVPAAYSGADLANTTDPTKGDALVGFRQSNSSGNLAGAIGRTVHQKFQEFVSAQDFGASSSGDVAAINAAMAYAIANNAVVNFDFDATIRIPTDAPNLQAAIDAINTTQNIAITLNIEAGHVLTSGFRITNRDCSFMQITSTDATVTVSPSMTLVSNTDLSSDVPRSTLIGFLAVRSKMPTWNILVDMVGLSCVSGYELDYESDGVVNPSKGVINTAWAGGLNGVNCRVTSNSRLQAAQSVWTGAKAGNMTITLNAFANLQDANLSSTSNEACLDISRGSVVHARGANCSSGIYAGIYARRSFISAEDINLTNCGIGVWGAVGSFVGVNNAIFTGCTTDVICADGSFIGLGRAQKSGADLDPADSIVQGATSGSAAPRAFNLSGGYGTIAYANNLSGDAEALSANSGTQSITSASLQSIPTLTYATALSLTGKYIIHGGTIYGADVGVKITIDGNVILNDGARVLGDDSAGNTISIIQIPACKCESTILIEAYNRASTTKNLGWRIYHSGAL